MAKEIYEAGSSEVYGSTEEMRMHEKTESTAEQAYEKWMGGAGANSLDAYKKWKTSGDN